MTHSLASLPSGVAAARPAVPSSWTAAALREWDLAHIWHPFTPHSVYPNEAPLMVVSGEGHYLIDAEGKRYLDGVGSLWCNLFGHRRPEIDAAIMDQLGRIAHATFLGHASAPAVALAKRLIDLAPEGLTRVFFSDDGSTAVEVALKLSLQYWQQVNGGRERQRTRFLTFSNAYHGDTVGSVSLGGIDLFHERYRPLLFDTVRAPVPGTYRSAPDGADAVAALERLVEHHGAELAAIVLEPGVQGAAGMAVQPEGFVRRVRELADHAGALLILDEVAVGFGRSGRMFACEREGVAPDLLCLGKGLTGGYLPMAATLATESIFEAFLGPPAEGRTFFHGHTYTGNALAAAAAHATLDIFERQGILRTLPEKIEYLAHALDTLRDLPAVGEIRQYGLAAGIELVAERSTKTSFAAAQRRGMQVCIAARELGVFLRPLGDVIVIMPPLTLTTTELDTLVRAIRHGITAVCSDAAIA